MKPLITAVTLFFILAIASSSQVFAGKSKTGTVNLVIHITGFETTDGVAKVALVNSQENYESGDNPFMGFNFKIINNEVLQTITLPQGDYAIKVYHDENANDEMDTLMFGIPKEKYGFSNNARGTIGPPEFDEAKFSVTAGEHKISIKVQ